MIDHRNPLTITTYPDGSVGFVSTGVMVVADREFEVENGALDELEQRQILAWFAREKPQMVREAMGMDKVLKELEKETTKAFKEMTHEFLDQDTYRSGIIHGCTKAITLLKGEVGK